MARTIRFHLDENCQRGIADGLLHRGIDVSMTPDSGLMGASDEQQLSFGRTHERVVVTHDPDLLRQSAAGIPHTGIAYSAKDSKTVGQIIQSLVLIWELLDRDEIVNRVEFL